MNVLSIAKIERHMAGEIHQISHAHIRNMGRMDGVALFQLGIPPDGNTAQQVCHAAQAGAINARRGFAAPAVGRAKVALGCLGNGCTQLFLVLLAGLGIQRGQRVRTQVTGAAIRQRYGLPAVFRLPCTATRAPKGRPAATQAPCTRGSASTSAQRAMTTICG